MSFYFWCVSLRAFVLFSISFYRLTEMNLTFVRANRLIWHVETWLGRRPSEWFWLAFADMRLKLSELIFVGIHHRFRKDGTTKDGLLSSYFVEITQVFYSIHTSKYFHWIFHEHSLTYNRHDDDYYDDELGSGFNKFLQIIDINLNMNIQNGKKRTMTFVTFLHHMMTHLSFHYDLNEKRKQYSIERTMEMETGACI